MVLIAGSRQGVPSVIDGSGRVPQIIISSMRQQLINRFDRDMTVSIIPADGDPQAQATERLVLDVRNGEKRQQSPENNIVRLSNSLGDVRASSGESDLLGALDAGGRASATAADKTLYVYDSGVSTAGPLAMQNGLLGTGTDVSTIVESLRTAGNIPALNGVMVQWWALGQVAAPQSDPPVWARSKLKELWTAVVEAGGGKVTFHDDAVLASPPAGSLPKVTPVEFGNVQAKPVSLTIPESQISFLPNAPDFVDAESAMKSLHQIAAILKDSSGQTLWVTGCTANPAGASASVMQDLSKRRAHTVADALTKAGLSATLKVQGLGPACPGRSPETGSGADLEASHAKNRLVLITSRELAPIPVQG
ncbi:OmpA family protein [Arthrobacter oryzae]|nr:OmpA family protein [Arthrobacter oryzae]